MIPTIDLLFDVNQNFYHASLLYTGLFTLDAQKKINLKIRKPDVSEKEIMNDIVICFYVIRDNSKKLVAVDLSDDSKSFSGDILKNCDIYLKRSYNKSDIGDLKGFLSGKVYPFGMNYACVNNNVASYIFKRSLFSIFDSLDGVRQLRNFLFLPNVKEFEQFPTSTIEPTVVFQTRVWEDYDTAPGESEVINEERVALIRALKQSFGDRFRGGLVPTPLALSRYPNEISVYPSRRSLYTAMSKRNLIAINTRGLYNSIAFKLPEYIAASQCIVTENIRNELPKPMVVEKNFLSFLNPNECVVACERLFADYDLSMQMRKENNDFYVSEVEPSAHVTRILERHTNAFD